MRERAEHLAPARLHWGLFHLPGPGDAVWPALDGFSERPARRFGGVGLMIDRPATHVRVAAAQAWAFHDARVEAAARRYLDSINCRRPPLRIEVLEAPEPHAGLGSGTQLAMAVGRALEQLLGRDPEPASALARRVGRGDRSAVGIYGSERGGLIVDAGKLPGEAVAGMAGVFRLPDGWRVVLAFPEVARRWHGEAERAAFADLAADGGPGRLRAAEASARLVLLEMLPALHAADFDGFAEAVGEFNARSGDLFAPAQGGRYADPAITATVAGCQRLGFAGCGQSSWGPCVFALAEDAERAEWLASHINGQVVKVWQPATSPPNPPLRSGEGGSGQIGSGAPLSASERGVGG